MSECVYIISDHQDLLFKGNFPITGSVALAVQHSQREFKAANVSWQLLRMSNPNEI